MYVCCAFIFRDWRLRTMTSNEKRVAEREALRSVIQQWNANRLDLFELSEPDEVSVLDAETEVIQHQSLINCFFSSFHVCVFFVFVYRTCNSMVWCDSISKIVAKKWQPNAYESHLMQQLRMLSVSVSVIDTCPTFFMWHSLRFSSNIHFSLYNVHL